jgi:hypothetical protein
MTFSIVIPFYVFVLSLFFLSPVSTRRRSCRQSGPIHGSTAPSPPPSKPQLQRLARPRKRHYTFAPTIPVRELRDPASVRRYQGFQALIPGVTARNG